MLVILASLVVASVAALLLLPMASDAWSLLRSRAGARQDRRDRQADTPRLLFLVPAHNEALLITNCVESLLRLRYPSARRAVVVVADNCTDATAELAQEAGAEVLERRDLDRPGKPDALAWALGRLPLEEFDAVVLVDADCIVDLGFAAALAAAAPLRHKAVQAHNGVRNPTENALTRMAAVFNIATYRFAYPLKQRAGLNVPLRGAGGCIGTAVLRERGWDAFTIGEDWELYAQLTERGVPIEYVPNARLFAQEARSLQQGRSQRERWSAGRLTVLARRWRSIVGSPGMSLHQKLDLLGELVAPGPVVHLGLCLVLAALTLALKLPGMPFLLLALGIPLLRHALYAGGALRGIEDRRSALMAFGYLILYAPWRLLTELTALRMVGDKPWIRTGRHRPTTADSPTP